MKFSLASSTSGAQAFLALSLFGTIAALFMYGISFNVIGLIILGYFLYGCLGIVITFHRNLTHNSFKTHPWIVKLFSILGCMAGTGSPLAWVAIHINHHIKSDKPTDPHSPLYKGLSIFTLDYIGGVDNDTKWRMRNLVTDKFHQFLHRYYFLIIAAWSLLLFSIGGFYLMVFLHWAPAAVTGIMSNVVNYVGHSPKWLGSYRRFSLNDRSANNWLWALPSWGEAWHNNHHRFPKEYYFGRKWWEVDISGLLIKLIKT
jgi:fatty-acid desaturase